MICCCILAGTKACKHCFNNSDSYSWTQTITTNIPIDEDFTKEDYKEILKYILDKKEKGAS